jgi:2-polyprenyl-6-hydroxyphenyl methylase/3-demethylubiquinone-9 3-methyltransferase
MFAVSSMGEATLTRNVLDNTDPREVAYYERLATRWWDPKGPFWPLHRLNASRLRYIEDQLAKRFRRNATDASAYAGLRMLDIGCGGGLLSEPLAERGASVLGIDVVEKNILTARLHAARRNLPVRYDVDSAENLAQQGQRFDVVLTMEVVEHVPHLPSFMAAATALVAPGGMLFAATINRTVWSWLFAIVGAEYVLRWLPRGTHRWRQFPRPSELEEMLRKGGLQLQNIRGVRVNPLTRSFHLTDWLAVNYMLTAERRHPS